jgi:hypothetical protein
MNARFRGAWACHALATLACIALVPCAAFAAITSVPSLVTVTAGQTSATINLEVSTPVGGPVVPGPVTVVFAGLPPGVTTIPSPVSVTLSAATGSGSVQFQLATSAATPGGTYPLTLTTSPDVGAGVGLLTLVVQAPTFDASISPVPLSLAWGGSAPVTVTTIAGGGFSSPVTYSFGGFPAGISTGAPQTVGAPYPPATFTFSVAPRTQPGTYSGSLTATWTVAAPQTRTFPMTVVVQQPTVTAAFTPPMLALVDGGPSAQSMLGLTPGAGYSGTPSLSWGPLPAGITVAPATPTSPALPPAQSVAFTFAAKGATVGPHNLALRVTDAGAGIDVTATIVLNVSPPYDAAISVAPPSVMLSAGGTANLVVNATGLNGFTGTLDVVAPSLPSLTFSPASFTIRAGESKPVAIQASANAPPGFLSGTFVATAAGITGQRTATVSITITPRPPEITSATPPALTAGTVGTVVRLTGVNFRAGAVVTFTPAGPVVTSAAVKSETLAEIVVTTPPETKSGTYRVDLRNPDGTSTAQGTRVIVCPPSTLGAALGVPTAAIVFPRPWTAISGDERVRPRAVLATTGIGTIVGTWRLDGIPFDQFAIAVSGGLPVEVEAKMPIPLSSAGEHRLELVIEQPQRLTTEPVPVILTVESHSRLRVIAPDSAVVRGDSRPLVRWSLVPGASGYEVEIDPESSPWPVRVRVSASEWRPDGEVVAAIGAGTHRYRVAAVFPGEVRGEPTAWRPLVVANEQASSSAARVRPDRRVASPRLFRNVHLVAFSVGSLLSNDQEPEVAVGQEESAARTNTGQFAILGSASETDENEHVWGDAARLQWTGYTEILDESFAFKGTGDISGRKDLDPEYDTASESRAWQFELGAIQSGFREELRAGYSPPEFLDQSEFLSAGLARGGALAKITTPVGAFSYYDTFYDEAAGAASAYELSQQVRGAGWEAPAAANLGLLRVFGLQSRDTGDDSLSKSEADSVGLLWRKSFSPAASLVVEGAWGSLEATGSDDLDGVGVHVGLDGMSGTLTYAFNFRSVDAGLVNPANLGLTPGAVPDRIGGDLTLGKAFGARTLSMNLRRQQSGSLADGSGVDVTEDSGGIAFMTPLGAASSMMLSSSLTTISCDGDLEQFLPGTDRTMVVVGVSFSETVGRFSLSQSLGWQDVMDDVTPAFDQTVTTGSLTFAGTAGAILSMTAMLAGTRSESAPPVGVTDLLMATLQPTLRWAGPGISITPVASFTRIDSELGGTSDTEQYQVVAAWSPSWWNSLVNAQIAADWFRTSMEGFPTPSFQRRVVASVVLRWGRSWAPASPGTAPVALAMPDAAMRLAALPAHAARQR